jgi:hypothetical protein
MPNEPGPNGPRNFGEALAAVRMAIEDMRAAWADIPDTDKGRALFDRVTCLNIAVNALDEAASEWQIEEFVEVNRRPFDGPLNLPPPPF